MKNILLISFALLLVSGCNKNPVADDTPSVTFLIVDVLQLDVHQIVHADAEE